LTVSYTHLDVYKRQLLIRASGRVKELAVRQALGASQAHVVSETLIETTLLTLAGGLLGLAVGAAGIYLLRALGVDRLPLGGDIAFDARLALAGLFAAILMGMVLAAPIAWFNLRRHLGNALQSQSRGATSGRAAQILRHGFIVSQIALAFILLAGAGLLGLSLQRVMAVSPGFQSDHVLTGQILLPWADYSDTARLAFVETLTDNIGHLPGDVYKRQLRDNHRRRIHSDLGDFGANGSGTACQRKDHAREHERKSVSRCLSVERHLFSVTKVPSAQLPLLAPHGQNRESKALDRHGCPVSYDLIGKREWRFTKNKTSGVEG